MTKTVPLRKPGTIRVSLAMMAIFLFAVFLQESRAESRPTPYPNTRDTIVIKKNISSRKYKVKLYPNAGHEVFFFSASGRPGKVYQLFLFDIEGKLVKQVNVRNRETTVVQTMEKGNYIFEIFSDDEKIENGQLIIR